MESCRAARLYFTRFTFESVPAPPWWDVCVLDLTFERRSQHGRHLQHPQNAKRLPFPRYDKAPKRDAGTRTNPGASHAGRARRPVRAAWGRPSQTKSTLSNCQMSRAILLQILRKSSQSLVPARVSGQASPRRLKTCISVELKLLCDRQSCGLKQVWCEILYS